MKLVNPKGRNLSGGAQPMACYCASDGGDVAVNFNSARGNDTCAHCGCYCDSFGLPFPINTGTYGSTATNTNRTSSI
ncbi:Apre_1838 family putative sactipeptide bacteriocin [Peptoniphilus asaccharolyticus]